MKKTFAPIEIKIKLKIKKIREKTLTPIEKSTPTKCVFLHDKHTCKKFQQPKGK